MNVHVRFFASLKEATGTGAVDVSLPEGAGFDALMEALSRELSGPAMAAVTRENVRLARNQDLVSPPFALRDGDELAFLPPVTGG